MLQTTLKVTVTILCFAQAISADDVLYRYEADVLPSDPSTELLQADPCEPPCSETIEFGHLIMSWTQANDWGIYQKWIAHAPDPGPATLWVEFRFRSNHSLPFFSFQCDGDFYIAYASVQELLYLYGDAAISISGDDAILGLMLDEFHVFRFESRDGVKFLFAADGVPFWLGTGSKRPGNELLQFGGFGGCLDDQIPNMVNEWDYVRYGTITYGEQIVASDPPQGFIDARAHPSLDRFTVTYDSPNYAYIDEISVGVTGASVNAPQVIATRRLDNGEPDTVEIVLDRPIPYNATTRFTFNDGVATNTIEFTYAPGDIDGDGVATLADFAAFQNCFGRSTIDGVCPALDNPVDELITLGDYHTFSLVLGQ